MNFSNNVTVTVPGLKQEIKLIHITDCHISSSYETSGRFEKEADLRARVQWRPEGRPVPLVSLHELLDFCKMQQPTLTVMTGDMVDLPYGASVNALKEALADADIPYLYVFGNHESAGPVTFEQSDCAFYPIFAPYMRNTPGFQVLPYDENGQSCSEKSAAVFVVGMDDSSKKINPYYFDLLKQLSAKGKPIILCMHIPIATENNIQPILNWWHSPYFLLGYDEDTDNITNEFCEFVRSEQSNVAAILCGHIHFSLNTEFAPGRMQIDAGPGYDGFAGLVSLVPDHC